jgi:hypothetical protein
MSPGWVGCHLRSSRVSALEAWLLLHATRSDHDSLLGATPSDRRLTSRAVAVDGVPGRLVRAQGCRRSVRSGSVCVF